MKEEKYKINKITPEEWWESKNSVFNVPFYPARYCFPRPWHRSYIAPEQINYNTDDVVFLTPNNSK